MLRCNNRDVYIFQCEYELKHKDGVFYENSGCDVIGIPVVKPKDWKIGHIDTCSFCGRESINVKERTVIKPEDENEDLKKELYDASIQICTLIDNIRELNNTAESLNTNAINIRKFLSDIQAKFYEEKQ